MNREKVIVILHYYRDADKAIKMNERVIKNLEDQYYSALGAVNSDGMPHGKGTTSNPVERVVLNIPRSVTQTIDRLRCEIEEIGKIKAEIAEELKCLNYTEKALIQGFYIHCKYPCCPYYFFHIIQSFKLSPFIQPPVLTVPFILYNNL